MDKITLRRQLRQTRQSLSPTQKKHHEQAVHRLLKRFIKRNKRLAIYWAVGSELNLHALTKVAHQRGAFVYLPYIQTPSKRLWFTPYPQHTQKAERQRGRIAIPQFQGKKIRAEWLHILIVPMVGIDQRGFRLGQGGGFYDATLAATQHRLRPRTVAVGFSCQQCAFVPNEPHDISMKHFVCEQGIHTF